MLPVILLAAHATGIALVLFVAPWSLAGYGMAIGLLLMVWFFLRHSSWGWLPFLCLLLMAGFLNASRDLRPPAAVLHISHFADGAPLILEGRILVMESRGSGGYRLRVEMRQVHTPQGKTHVSGEILLYIKEGTLEAHPGQVIRWRSTLKRPLSFGNPGEFDYPLYLAAHGIHVTAFIAQATQAAILVNQFREPSALLEEWRHLLATHIAQTVPDETAGLLQSLLLGMRGGISNDQRELLSASGVAHLFAISGLHFGLLALLLYQVSRWGYSLSTRLLLWCPPQKVLPILLLFPLAMYLFLTGNAWATRRAFLMVTVVALLFARGRRTPPLSLLATVALCLLLVDPLALFQPGFQLSFCGAAGILGWLPYWQRPLARLAKPLRWPLSLILTTTAASLATAPATLWHFHMLAPAGLLTNLIAVPIVAWGAVPAGLASIGILPFSNMLADLGLRLSAWLVKLALDSVGCIIEWPGLSAIPYYLTASALVILIGSLLVMLPFGNRPSHWFARLVILAVSLGAAWLVKPQIGEFQVIALSVGQGDATLVTLSGGKHYLIDGGGLPGSSIDPGKQLVGPALGRMGIDSLQGVILSHKHPDHSSGLAFILRRFPVKNFYLAEEIVALPPELQEALQETEVNIHRINQGWTRLQIGQSQTLNLFAPAQNSADINERSIAVFAEQQGHGVLLTADLGKSGLWQLLEAGVPGTTTLLKLPHHGSRHAHPELYLDRFKPSIAFVSSGHGNPYGFPHPQTIEACSEQQVRLFRTDLEGMLTFRFQDGRWQAQVGKPL